MQEEGCLLTGLFPRLMFSYLSSICPGPPARGSTAPPISVNSQENVTDMSIGQWKHSLN